MAAQLTLVPAIRTGIRYPNGIYKSERHFLDFVINGQSLWETVGKPRDFVSVLCREYARDYSISAVNRLLLREKGDLPNDRRSLFICSECGDLGCGAITLLIVREGDAIVWREFGFENNYEEDIERNKYEGLGPFTFDAAFYESALLQSIESLKTSKS